MYKVKLCVMTLIVAMPLFSFAQKTTQPPARKEVGKFAVLAGLHQPIVLRGGNFAFNYSTLNNIALEASFGVALDYDAILSDAERLKYQSVETPFSYGVGIGYFYKGLSLNFEPKGTMFRIQDFNNQTVQ